eukprot:2259226-Pyramimonas_sp.AAC.1
MESTKGRTLFGFEFGRVRHVSANYEITSRTFGFTHQRTVITMDKAKLSGDRGKATRVVEGIFTRKTESGTAAVGKKSLD